MFFLSTYIVSKSYLLHCLHQLICSVPAFLLLRQHLTFTICSHYLQDILVFVNIFIQLTLSTSNHLSRITYLSDSKPQLQRLDNSPNSPGYQEIQPNTAGLNTQGKEVNFFFFFFFTFGQVTWLADSQFPNQGLTLGPGSESAES